MNTKTKTPTPENNNPGHAKRSKTYVQPKFTLVQKVSKSAWHNVRLFTFAQSNLSSIN